MKTPSENFLLNFKGTGPGAGTRPTIPEQVGSILQAASSPEKISHTEARMLLAQIKDVVLEETGLTRAQLDYELYLRTVPGD